MTPVEAASRAESALTRYCADIVSLDTTRALDGMAVVSATTGDVSRAWESSKEPFLLYWRGALLQCLGQDDRAEADLTSFLNDHASDDAYADLVRDARRRLRRLGTATGGSSPGPHPAALVAGVSLAGFSGVSGGLSGWRAAALGQLDSDYHSGNLRGGQYAAVESQALQAAAQSNVLLVTSIASAVGSAAVLAVGGAVSRGQGGVAAVLIPQPHGLSLQVGGRW